jgi:hypothetical protein
MPETISHFGTLTMGKARVPHLIWQRGLFQCLRFS